MNYLGKAAFLARCVNAMLRGLSAPRSPGDKGNNGGIARCVEYSGRYCNYDIEVVDDVHDANVIAMHAGSLVKPTSSEQVMAAHCHGLYWEDFEWDPWAIELNKEVIKNLKQSDACTAPSEWVTNALRRGMRLDLVVINHGVDLDKFTPLDTSAGEQDLGYVLEQVAGRPYL